MVIGGDVLIELGLLGSSWLMMLLIRGVSVSIGVLPKYGADAV